MVRRLCALVGALTFGVVPLLAAPPASAAVRLPDGFSTVDYATGQPEYNLTNFAWTGAGTLLTIGKDGLVTYADGHDDPRTLGTVPGVRAVGDHGLLGLALANDYATTGHLYLGYDKGDPDGTGFGMLEEWKASPADDPTSLTKVRTIIDGSATSPPLVQDMPTHGVDSVVVAPDGSIYWSIGDDSGNNGDPRTLRAQDVDQPYGKVLHVTPDGKGVPTNPFYSSSAATSWRSRVFAYGFRNPFRMSLDPRSGRLLVGDVGWRTVEEIDSLTAGANAGWPCWEGNQQTTFSTYAPCAALYKAGAATAPIWTYTHSGQGSSVVAGDLYTGTAYPARYRNSFFVGDYSRGELWTLATDSRGAMTRAPETSGFATDMGGPVAFHAGPNGDVTYADLLSGNVRRLVYGTGNRAPVAAITTSVDAGTRTVSFSARSSYDLDQDALTHDWDFGDGSSATGTDVQHTYADDSTQTVTLTARDPLGATGTATAEVHPANHSPELDLTVPDAGRRYAVGDPVHLDATATDEEDGDLTVTWETVLRHCPFLDSCHLHPDGSRTGDAYTGGFTDHGSDTTMEITASATDSTGATTSRTYTARPDLHDLVVISPVPTDIDGTTTTSAQVVAGAAVNVVAPTSSSYWRFAGWSDRRPAAHGFTMPAHDVTLTASYTTVIDAKYAALGGSGSPLGRPTGPEQDVFGGRGRSYAGGQVLWSAATGAHEVHGAIARTFAASGGVAANGFPTGDQVSVTGGRSSVFTKARIYYSTATGSHVLRGPVLTRYLSAGGPKKYGLPQTDVTTVPGGAYATFTGKRSIYYTKGHGTHLVYGTIGKKYVALGAQRSCLGLPTSDEVRVAHGRANRFVGGTITYDRRTRRTTASC